MKEPFERFCSLGGSLLADNQMSHGNKDEGEEE